VPLKYENSASTLHIILVQKFALNSQYNCTNLYTAVPEDGVLCVCLK